MGKKTSVENLRLVDLIDRLAHLANSAERARIGQPGFREVHLRALKYLAQCNRYSNTPSALGEYLGSTKGTVSQTINILAERGLVEKYADRDDKRVTRIGLTAAGRSLTEESGGQDHLETLFVDALSPQEHQALTASLLTCLRALQKSNRGQVFGLCFTCKHFNKHGLGDQHQCGLTSEPLSPLESEQICREHQFAP